MAKGSTIGTRVRKNIKHLTQDEWARFINALKVIKGRSRPGGSISIYDEFTALHMGAVELYRTWVRKWQDKNLDPVDLKKPWADPAHDNPGFLPWHRQLLLEFEAALQEVDPTVTLPYWDWTDREFNKRLFSDEYVGGNGGYDGKGGALVNGPFTLHSGWAVEPALHRPAWFVRGPGGTSVRDPDTANIMEPKGKFKVQPSLGRSIVRYLGDFEDLATKADIIEFTKRKSMFGPPRLVLRSDTVPTNPVAAMHSQRVAVSKFIPREKSLPLGTIHIGPSLPPIGGQGLPPTDTDRNYREDVVGFRWGLEGSPHMHNQTHDWFGFYTTILQDDLINGASTMPNVACSTTDPMFFLHHCNIDRLWAEWQDSGHYGTTFFPKRSDHLNVFETVDSRTPIKKYTYPDGHNLDDEMWPWNNNKIQTEEVIQEMIPQFSYTLTPRELIDYRKKGYRYDTSRELAVNSVAPVIVHLPSRLRDITHQVFLINIQREANYIVSAWDVGTHPTHVEISIYGRYEELWELEFVSQGFKGNSIEALNSVHSGEEPSDEEGQKGTKYEPITKTYTLPRGTYYVVVKARLSNKRNERFPIINAAYAIAIATSAPPPPEEVPITPGVITDPQVPAESAAYIPKHRYAPTLLDPGETYWRTTQIKGTHELFGINVDKKGGRAKISFKGMDALAQLYGPFNLDNDSLPQFDDDGKTRDKGSKTRLSSQLQIATSEGCCRRDGTEIDAMVSPGRYVLIIFHCSIGANENQIYSVTYNLDTTAPFKELSLGKTAIDDPLGRSVDLLYIVTNANGSGMLLTQNDQSFKIQVFTDDADTQKQVRIGVYAYAGEEVLPDSNLVDYVSYRYAWWGEDVVSFEASQNEVLFVRVTILNGHRKTRIRTLITTK